MELLSLTYKSSNSERVILVLIVLILNQILGEPSPVMSFPDSGVYSIFPNEDLRTGKSVRTEIQEKSRGLGRPEDESYRDQFPRTRGGGGREILNNRRIITNRIFFDDERLNFRNSQHFDSSSRDTSPLDLNQRPIIYNSREERFPFVPAYGEARLPPGHEKNEEPTRIHIFNPDTLPPPPTLPDDDENSQVLRAGRILIPPRTSFLDLREPGPDTFLNHDEFLDYHTKAAIAAAVQSEEERTRRPCLITTDARRLLFSPNIHGLIPPTSESKSTESLELPQLRSLEEEKVPVTSLLDNNVTPRFKTVVTKPILESGFIPLHIVQRGEEELSRTHKITETVPTTEVPSTETVEVMTSTITTTTNRPTTVKGRTTFPWVKKSSYTPGHITRIKSRPIVSNNNTPFVKSILLPPTSKTNNEESETITFSPNTFDDFVRRKTSSAEFAATKIRSEVPLIFLESSQQDLESDKRENTAIFVQRLKNSKNFEKDGKGTNKSKLPLSIIESTMTVHETEINSSEEGGRDPLTTSTEFRVRQSFSNNGVVAKVHAHISECPKLHAGAEIICDVHIRKRHGNKNPQLTVGWKRKFQNSTKDLILAVNTTLAYIEEDFHDKFNVTLAPGISPMLRSVLTIRHVSSTDTGNYECQVDDGQNKLKSDTLLFLCH